MYQYVGSQLKLEVPANRKNSLPEPFNAKKIFADENDHLFTSVSTESGRCSYYRMRFVSEAIEQKYVHAVAADARLFFRDLNNPMLSVMDSIRLQRPNHSHEFSLLTDILLPAKKKNPFNVIYDIDDILVPEDMPLYNSFRDAFPEGKKAIPFFMEKCDIVTVSTKKLADYYIGKFNLDPDKFKIYPNYLPRHVFDRYSEVEAEHRFEEIGAGAGKRKPRICFSCSPSHFDSKDVNHGDDDFSEIMPWIMENRHRYDFVFHGGANRTIYENKDDFTLVPYGPFLDFPWVRRHINADLYIQPLKKSLFNECKSAIKILEAWAEGRPIFVQDINQYKEFSPESCFGSVEQLANMVDSLFSSTVDNYLNIVRSNYVRLQDYWMEGHVDDWAPILLRNH